MKKDLRKIVFCNILGVLLALSWLYVTPNLWRAIDEGIFLFFNQFVDLRYPTWTKFLAIINMRIFDSVSAGIMACLFVWSVYLSPGDRKSNWRYWISVGLVMLSVCLIVSLAAELITYGRRSPTLQIEGAKLLTSIEKIPHRDRSGTSFPGDHGIIVMIFAAFMFRFSKKRVAWFSAALVVILTAPRIMVGAHWFSDIYVGSLATCLIMVPWFLLTPFANKGVPRLFQRLEQRAQKKKSDR